MIVLDKNSEIEAVWMISEADETSLYNYEAFPEPYHKEMFDINCL